MREEVILKERERWLAGEGEGGVGSGEDCEGGGTVEERVRCELESESHG